MIYIVQLQKKVYDYIMCNEYGEFGSSTSLRFELVK